jgi:hypothetical protein
MGAGFVTIDIGLNDACDPFDLRGGQATPLSTFASQFTTAMNILASSPAHPRILVASIPNAARTWDLFHGDANALVRWQFPAPPGIICAPLLANPTSLATTDAARRAAFTAQIVAYNTIEAGICRTTPRCQTDGGALFDWASTADDYATVTDTGGVNDFPFNVPQLTPVGPGAISDSTADYWHPSRRGQSDIAALEWNASGL